MNQGAWALWGFVSLCGLGASFVLTSTFMDKRSFDYLPIFSSIFGLAASFSLIALLPLDVYGVSGSYDAGEGLYLAYYLLLFFAGFFAVGFIPFSYFYQEEDAEGASWKSKSKTAIKKSAIFWIIFALSFALGTLIEPHTEKYQDDAALMWIDDLFKNYNEFERSLTLALGLFSTIGFIPLIIYMGYGLVALPLKFLRGKQSHKQEVESVSIELDEIRSRKEELEAKYPSESKMPRKERREYDDLRSRESALTNRSEKLSSFSVKCRARCFTVISPFFFLIGLFFAIVSLLFFVSILTTTFDRLANSTCGVECGFLVDKPHFNPIDQLLISTSEAFPSDYTFFSGLVLYLFSCTVYGILQIGLRNYKLKKINIVWRKTPATSLLATIIVLILSTLSIFVLAYSAAPQYTTFGSEQYLTGKDKSDQETCHLTASSASCELTQYATIHHRVIIDISLFCMLYLIFNIFLFISFFASGVSIMRAKPESNIPEPDEAEERLV